MNINNSLGVLYIVATPIGNLQDMSLRAVEVLKTVDCIVAEDTRHSQSLLQHFSITTPVTALHEHNERERTQQLLTRLLKGESLALISDAGTPLISDPGYHLVRALRIANIKIVPLPGACAAIAALSAAGLPTDRFVFEGFLPAKAGARLQRLKNLQSENRTMIFYEAPHRILDLLEALQEVFGDTREMVLARELTKLFETIKSGTISEILVWAKADSNQQRGEMVVMVAGSSAITTAEEFAVEKTLKILLAALPLKQAVEIAAEISGQKKNAIYDQALIIKKGLI
jgi:16S rRNA (cytidine1402-2'-O)-methyltransferase